ncbi:hypothetical protein SALBM311S_10204 [Streptomyces alboniger]
MRGRPQAARPGRHGQRVRCGQPTTCAARRSRCPSTAPRRVRPTVGRERALRVLLVPAHRQHQHQAQQPQRGPGTAGGAAGGAGVRGRVPLQWRLPGGAVGRPRGVRWTAPSPGPPAAGPPNPTSRTRFHPPRRVRVEMEYGVPRAAVAGGGAELRAMVVPESPSEEAPEAEEPASEQEAGAPGSRGLGRPTRTSSCLAPSAATATASSAPPTARPRRTASARDVGRLSELGQDRVRHAPEEAGVVPRRHTLHKAVERCEGPAPVGAGPSGGRLPTGDQARRRPDATGPTTTPTRNRRTARPGRPRPPGRAPRVRPRRLSRSRHRRSSRRTRPVP